MDILNQVDVNELLGGNSDTINKVLDLIGANTPTVDNNSKKEQMPGDVDADGELTSADARLALRASVGLEKQIRRGTPAFRAADVDCGGEVTSSDARLILRASVKLEDPATFGKKL